MGVKQDLADRDWWRRVGALLGTTLHGWSYRNSALFVNPQMDVSGQVASVLLEQQDKIERLQKYLSDLRQLGKEDDLREIADICNEALEVSDDD